MGYIYSDIKPDNSLTLSLSIYNLDGDSSFIDVHTQYGMGHWCISLMTLQRLGVSCSEFQHLGKDQGVSHPHKGVGSGGTLQKTAHQIFPILFSFLLFFLLIIIVVLLLASYLAHFSAALILDYQFVRCGADRNICSLSNMKNNNNNNNKNDFCQLNKQTNKTTAKQNRKKSGCGPAAGGRRPTDCLWCVAPNVVLTDGRGSLASFPSQRHTHVIPFPHIYDFTIQTTDATRTSILRSVVLTLLFVFLLLVCVIVCVGDETFSE
eukprot:gene8736-6142_t